MFTERPKADQNLIEVSSQIYEQYLDVCFSVSNNIDRFDEILVDFIHNLKEQYPNLSASNAKKNINIVSNKIIQYNAIVNKDLVNKILFRVIELFEDSNNPEILNSQVLKSLFWIATNSVLESFEDLSSENLYSLVSRIGKHVIQIEGVVNSDLMPEFQGSLKLNPNDILFYLDGSGKSLSSTDLFQIFVTIYGKSIIIDHHHQKVLDNPSTIEMYVTVLADLLNLDLKPLFSLLKDFKTSKESEKNFLSKAIIDYLNSFKIDQQGLVIIDIFINFLYFKKVINQPDPDSITPISVYNFILFWDNLFTSTEFNNIPIEDYEARASYLKRYAKISFRTFVKNPITDILETAIYNQYSDLNFDILKLGLNNCNEIEIAKAQLDFIISRYYSEIQLSDADYMTILNAFVDTIYIKCNSVEACLIEISHRMQTITLDSVTLETVLAIFNRLYVYRHRSLELIQKIKSSKDEKNRQVEVFLKSDLFNNSTDEIESIYKAALEKADLNGDHDSICLYCIQEFLNRIKTIVNCISIADARGGIIPFTDFTGKIKLPKSIAYAFNNEINDVTENSVFDRIESLVKTSFTKTPNTLETTILSLIMASLTNHIHEYARRMMGQFRDRDFITSHIEFKFHTIVMLSLMMAFNRNDIDHFVSVTKSYFPMKEIKFNHEKFYDVSISLDRKIKVVNYIQSKVPANSGGMDRTIAMIKENPDMMVIYVGKAGKVGFYNYTVALTNHEQANLMNAFVNFISIFTTLNLGQLTVQEIINNIRLVNLHSGSNYAITGFRTVGVTFGPNEMKEFVDIFVKVYELLNLRPEDPKLSKKYDNYCTIFIHNFIEWIQETSDKLLDPQYHLQY